MIGRDFDRSSAGSMQITARDFQFAERASKLSNNLLEKGLRRFMRLRLHRPGARPFCTS